ncbi:MAG: YggS family pyridoxal phosphate-dependent enzyme [Hyphomicrobiales bacterium]
MTVSHHPALENVRAAIRAAALAAGRDPADIRLVAVSKTKEAPEILPVLEAGQRVFGENRVQEAKGKWPALRQTYPDVELHLIGPLQTNKAEEAVQLFDVIQTVDRPRIAQALMQAMTKLQRRPKLFLQVNTGREAQKSGLEPTEVAAFAAAMAANHGLSFEGLMCIPPVDADPAPHFALLARLAAELGLKALSMGMSGDFETAIAHGATLVRVGSAIFGARQAAHSPQAR